MKFRVLEALSAVVFLAACSEHQVDTFPEWCEQISGVDLEEKYRPAWAAVFSVSFSPDEVRDDFVTFLDETHLEKVDHRAPRMAWRETTDLHLVNLSSLLVVEPEEVIEGWRRGIDLAKSYSLVDPADICLYGTITSLFDNMHIHSMEPDALGANWTEKVTVIPTDREVRLGDDRL